VTVTPAVVTVAVVLILETLAGLAEAATVALMSTHAPEIFL
jgi:hypothetical protein